MTPVHSRVAEHVATIMLDRPERRNAFTPDMFDLLADALLEAEADAAVRSVVLTGAGDAFSAGLDLVAAAEQRHLLETLAFDFDADRSPVVVLQRMDTPVIAAVNGPAAGYAVGLALNADIRVMAEGARFVPATKRGIVPESGDTYLLPRLAGWEQAARFFFLGDDVDAAGALAGGLVSELAADADATRARAAELAARVAAMPPLAVAAAKRLMRAGRTDAYDEHVRRVLLQVVPLFGTADFAEAVAAFLEKRDPTFTGR
jgi:enoyl-CoA hydratase/carnithine racemase